MGKTLSLCAYFCILSDQPLSMYFRQSIDLYMRGKFPTFNALLLNLHNSSLAEVETTCVTIGANPLVKLLLASLNVFVCHLQHTSSFLILVSHYGSNFELHGSRPFRLPVRSRQFCYSSDLYCRPMAARPSEICHCFEIYRYNLLLLERSVSLEPAGPSSSKYLHFHGNMVCPFHGIFECRFCSADESIPGSRVYSSIYSSGQSAFIYTLIGA